MSLIIKIITLASCLAYLCSEKMTLSDWNVCNSCLSSLGKLKQSKNSGVCEGGNLERNLICYEIYYYLYYFQSDLFFTPASSIKEGCNVCSYLDKCQFYECIDIGISNKETSNTNLEKLESKKQTENDIKSQSNKTSLVQGKDNLNTQSFKQVDNQVSDDMTQDHLDIIKSKTQKIIAKLLNLAEINLNIHEIKKNLVNLFIFEKLKKNSKYGFSKNNTIIKIKNKNFEQNYLKDVRKTAEDFMNLLQHFDDNIDKLKEIKTFTLLVQSYNELNKLAEDIDKENRNNVDVILRDFTEEKFKLLERDKEVNISRDKIIVKSHIPSLKGVKMGIKNTTNVKDLNFEELKIIIEKLSKIEKDQELFKSLLINNQTLRYKATNITKEIKTNYTLNRNKTAPGLNDTCSTNAQNFPTESIKYLENLKRTENPLNYRINSRNSYNGRAARESEPSITPIVYFQPRAKTSNHNKKKKKVKKYINKVKHSSRFKF